MVFSLYIGKYCPFFSYVSCHSISYRCFSIYISIKNTLFFFIFASIPYIAFSQTVFLYIVLNTLFILIFCPDSKFLYLAYIYDIKDILFLLVPPQNLCVFSYIYMKNNIFLCILPKIIYIAIFLYIFMLSSD